MTFFYFFFVQIVEKLEAVQCVCVCVSLQTCCSSLSERTVSSHSLLVRLGMSAVLSGCVVDIFFFLPLLLPPFFWCNLVLGVQVGVALCHNRPASKKKKKKTTEKTNRGLSHSRSTVADVAPRHWLPTQTSQWESWKVGGGVWARRSLSVPCLLLVRWPVQFSKYTIWVMVGIQGRVVAIDFSAFFTAHRSKLRPDGRSRLILRFLFVGGGGKRPLLLYLSSYPLCASL